MGMSDANRQGNVIELSVNHSISYSRLAARGPNSK